MRVYSFFTVFLIIFMMIVNSLSQTTKVYWIHQDSYNGKVQSSELDGSALTNVVEDLNMPCGLAIDDKSVPQKIYFCIRGESKIMRTNLDGSDTEEIFTSLGNFLMGIGIGHDVPATAIERNTLKLCSFALKENYPNPFNPSTTIEFALPKSAFVQITVYNSLGEETETLISKNMVPGQYQVEFNGLNLSSGIYYYSYAAGEFRQVRKMVLLK